MRISRITRIDLVLTLDARLANGIPVSVSSIGVALMYPHVSPNEATAWTTTAYSGGTATITICGEDAGNTTSALIVPDTGADLWVKIDTGAEVETAKIERITVYDSEEVTEVIGHDGTITVGTVSALAAGSSPTVVNVGDDKNVQLNFGIPSAPVASTDSLVITKSPSNRYLTSEMSGAQTVALVATGQPIGTWLPIWAQAPIDRIGLEVTTAGGVGSVISLALYKMRTDGSVIGDFVLVSSDLAAASTGNKEAIISTTLQPGRYAALVSNKNSSGTAPVVRAFSGRTFYSASELLEVTDRRGGINSDQIGSPVVTSTWPSTITMSSGTRVYAPAIYLRTA